MITILLVILFLMAGGGGFVLRAAGGIASMVLYFLAVCIAIGLAIQLFRGS